MADYCLSCCSAVDLTPERMKQRELAYVCFKYTLDGREYLDDMGQAMSSQEHVQRCANQNLTDQR